MMSLSGKLKSWGLASDGGLPQALWIERWGRGVLPTHPRAATRGDSLRQLRNPSGAQHAAKKALGCPEGKPWVGGSREKRLLAGFRGVPWRHKRAAGEITR